MSFFGDIDPEDSWDPDDPVTELVDNVRRRVVAIVALHAVEDRIQQRLEMIGDDLEHVFARVRDRLIDRIVD